MDITSKEIELWNGVLIYPIGFGPGSMSRYMAEHNSVSKHKMPSRWNIPLRGYHKFVQPHLDRLKYVESIANGMRAGFRLLDYSAAYGTGDAIMDAVNKAGLHRDDVFLTGRVTNIAQINGVDAVKDQIRNILAQYRTDHVDLLMFHWPVTDFFENTWHVICEAYDKGLTRSIGVANCHRHHLERLEKVGLRPMVNQFEVHPLFSQKELIKYNQDKGIVVEAYTPIARYDDRLMRLPKLHAIAHVHGKTPVQVVLRWHIQNGCIPIVRSLNAGRQKEDFDVFDFELSKEEIDLINSFNINSRLRYDPDNCDFTIL